MASLEHFSKDGRDSYRLRFLIDKRRQSVGLGNFDLAAAIVAKAHIEHLIGQHRRNRPPLEKTYQWLEAVPSEIHDRLAAIGLVEARKRCELPRTVIAYMRAYIESRTDWKKPENYRQSANHLEKFLRGDVPLVSLTEGEAERWHRWLMDSKNGPKLSANTAGQHVKRCRQFMRQAIKDGLLNDNPFADVKIDLRADPSKNYEVTASDAAAILEACPDQEWRTIFALCRFGGLRCPSEVLKMRWADIAWDRGRMKVHAPKTQRYGKGERIVPLFPEVRSELEAMLELSEATRTGGRIDQYVIRRYRDSETNLRGNFHKILDRAGVARFAKPFMNCRTTRRNELDRQGVRNAALNAWFGHSKETAERHYDRVTEDDFADALESLDRQKGVAVGQLVGQSLGGREDHSRITDCKNPIKNPPLMLAKGSRGGLEYTPEDSNL